MQKLVAAPAPLVATPTPTSSWHFRLMHMPFVKGLQLISVVVVATAILPLIYLFLRAMGAGEEGIAYLLQPRTLEILWNSLLLVVTVMISSVMIGVPFAWLTTRTDLPFRQGWLVLGLLTLVVPSYLGAATFVTAFGPVGIIQSWLEPFEVQRLPDIYGFFGAWLIVTLFTYPHVVLPVRAALLNSDPALDEAAQSLGLARWQVFVKVTLPQLRPALISGTVLSGLYALSDFGAVAVMRYNAFTRAIFLQINGFRIERAALLSLLLIVITIILLAIEWHFSKRTVNYRIGIGAKRQAKTIRLGYWKIPALIFCGVIVALGVVTPIGVLLHWVFSSVAITNPITLNMPELMMNTAGVSGATALVTALVALPLSLLAIRYRSTFNNVLVSLAYTGYVLPSIVVALALVYFAANYANPVYQTIPLMVIGYSLRFLPYSISATRNALTQINPHLEEVARSLGKSSLQVLFTVIVPIAKTSILAGAALVFLSVIRELPITLILRPPSFDTLTTRIWMFYNEAFLPQIGIPGLLLMAISALALSLILWRDHQKPS